ncbi:MAG: hypothetical protein EKK46_06320 [Rhodocyclaceae bacterium]|nr:MAG: hypothetical protein EKK46_06320 [Rhodocyclaceae bacterium]
MVFTFSEPASKSNLTPAEHKRRLDALATKLPQVSPRTPAEIEFTRKRDWDISAAFGPARGAGQNNLKIPDGVVFTPEELELAAWIVEYAKRSSISFKDAMAQIFEYLKRNPDYLSKYTKANVDFAEVSSRTVSGHQGGFDYPQGSLEYLRKLRICQAGTGCDYIEAVRTVGSLNA